MCALCGAATPEKNHHNLPYCNSFCVLFVWFFADVRFLRRTYSLYWCKSPSANSQLHIELECARFVVEIIAANGVEHHFSVAEDWGAVSFRFFPNLHLDGYRRFRTYAPNYVIQISVPYEFKAKQKYFRVRHWRNRAVVSETMFNQCSYQCSSSWPYQLSPLEIVSLEIDKRRACGIHTQWVYAVNRNWT